MLEEVIEGAKLGQDANACLRHDFLWGHDGTIGKYYYDKYSILGSTFSQYSLSCLSRDTDGSVSLRTSLMTCSVHGRTHHTSAQA